MKGITKSMQENEMKIQERDSYINQLKMELDGKLHEISGLQKKLEDKESAFNQAIAEHERAIGERDRTINELKAEIQRVRGCSVNAVASAVAMGFSSVSSSESKVGGARVMMNFVLEFVLNFTWNLVAIS
jgi:hypothetical protein